MTTQKQLPSALLTEQVAHWLVRLHSGEMTAAEASELEQLLAQDSGFAREWQLQLLIWQQSSLLPEQLLASVASKQQLSGSRQQLKVAGLLIRRRFMLFAGTTAFIAAVLSWSSGWHSGLTPTISPPVARATASNEVVQLWQNNSATPLSVTLSDGSLLTLASGAQVKQLFSASARRVELLAGSAEFAVVKGNQPFIVESGTQAVTVLGTRFEVRRQSGDLTVKVSEGTVVLHPKVQQPAIRHSGALPQGARQLSSAVAAVSGQYRLSAGAELTVREATELVTQRTRPVSATLTIRSQTLLQTLAQFKQRGCPDVTVLSAKLASQHISGVFDTKDCERALLLLARLTQSELKSTGSGYQLQAQ